MKGTDTPQFLILMLEAHTEGDGYNSVSKLQRTLTSLLFLVMVIGLPTYPDQSLLRVISLNTYQSVENIEQRHHNS